MSQVHTHHSDVPAVARRVDLQNGLRLEYFSVAWNLLETLVGIAAGLASGSVALVGFALDSVIETSSAGILIWRLRTEKGGKRTVETTERRAIRLVALAFVALAAYVASQATIDLLTRSRPDASPVGMGLAITSLIVMPLLARSKRRLARVLDSRAMMADSSQTTLCTYLSAFLLVGLALNALLGWWWADPVAAIAIAGLAANEGLKLWRTEDICCP